MKTIASTKSVKKKREKPSKVLFSFEQYDNLMKGFMPLQVVGSEWEKKGDSFVQYSAYDESLICVSSASII